jgi:drug/metabolite transporter (DMT)-like permease
MTQVSAPALAAAVILVSALFHACANLLTKTSDDPLITRGCMNATALAISLPLIVWVPAPEPEVWPLLISSVLVHGLYPFFLVEAYRRADLSSAFPLARGSTPLFVALLSALFLHEQQASSNFLGVAIICIAIASFALERPSARASSASGRIGAALATGFIIAVYTLIDAIGVRMAATPWSYIVWLLLLDGLFVSLAVVVARGSKVPRFIVARWKSLLGAGILGVLAYGMALFALSVGSVTTVAALRESSVLFSALLGAIFLGEPFGARRIAAAAAIVVGIGLMHFG